MSSRRLLGIDIGTTGVRAAIFDESARLVGDASVACGFDAPQAGWAEIQADRWWLSVRAALGSLGAKVPLDDVTAIGVVGQAPTAVLVDDRGETLGSSVLWLDTRAEVEANELGVPAYYLGPKLLWLARHRVETRLARWVLQSHAFITYRLTGEVAIDPSTATLCLPLFDPVRGEWRGDVLARVGLRAEQLPPLRAAHEVVGQVTPAAASAIGRGLRAGVPVVAGGGDFAAATLGAGVIDEGEACLMLGTAGNLLVPRARVGSDPRLIHARHVGVDRALSLGGTLSGGAQEWLRRALVAGDPLPGFDVLDGEATQVEAGSERLLFLPYLSGERTPIWDARARGAYVGLSLEHGRGHLWRALLEGIALGFVDCQEVLEHDGAVFHELIAANGGGKSALFRQILCDALGVPLTYAPGAGGTVAGAAILAGLGAGVLNDASDARRWRGDTLRHEPNDRAHARYRALLRVRRDVYSGLRGAFAELATLR